MSLISDALKKAQSTRTPDQDKTEMSTSYLAPEKDAALPSKRSSSRIMLFLLLAIALSLSGYYIYITLLAPKDADMSASLPKENITAPIGENTISKLIPKRTTQEQTSIPEASDTPALTGIMYIGNAPQAVIDGEILSLGDTVSGYTISSISPNKVTLTNDAKTKELYLR